MLGSWRGPEWGGGEMGQSRSVMHKGVGGWGGCGPSQNPGWRQTRGRWALSSLSAPDKPSPPTSKAAGICRDSHVPTHLDSPF